MKKRLTAALLALCLVLGIIPALEPARAASFTVYVVSNTLPVYSKVSTSSSVLGTMSYGESMTCLATNDSWAAVRNTKGQIGFCKISGLSTANPNNLNKTAYITAANVPVYRKPSTSAGVMMKLSKNSKYTAVAVTGDKEWVRLQNGKYYGYVEARYISASASTTPAPEVNQTPSQNTTVYIISNTLKAYQKASTSSKSLGTMSFGESMTLLSASGSWACIRNAAGAVGYCKLSGLSSQNPNTYNQKIYISGNGVKVYRKPDTSSGVMQLLNLNESYTAVAATTDGGWLRLQNGKHYGYVQTKYTSAENIEQRPAPDTVSETYFVSDNTAVLYAEASEISDQLSIMSFGESVGLISVDDGWAKILSSAGAVGYCMYGSLTRYDPNTLSDILYAAEDGVTLHTLPQADAAVASTLSINTPVTMVAVTDDGIWARVTTGNGKFYFADFDKLSETKVAEDDGQIQDVTPHTVYISSTTLVFYAENNTESRILGTMSFGESLSCTGSGEGWARVVNSAGTIGYCKEENLTKTNPNTSSIKLYAQADGVNVYSKASTSSSVLMTLSLNTQVTGVAASSDKNWIRLYNGVSYGYVQASKVATSAVANNETSDTIAKVVSIAKEQTGIPYVYAAQSPSSGFDCSGLVYYAYKKGAGITLKRTAHTMGYDSRYTTINSRKDLKVGDLVFFNTVSDGADDLCDHVGIYLGNNKFIHASSAAAKVTTSSLGSSNSDYYYRTYSWAKRIIK